METLKSEKKRNYILDRARDVFVERGYARVTMKDIVEACQISRGGLYRYFGSTKAVFLALFHRDAVEEFERAEVEIWEELTAREILMDYFDKQKKELTGACPSIANAAYEFFLENPEDRVIFQWQFDGCAEMIREILEYGVRNEEFEIPDTAAFARHLALFLNSMQLSSPILDFPIQRIEEQFKIMLSPLL